MADNIDDHALLCTAVGALILAFAKFEGAVSAGLRLHLTFKLQKHMRGSALNLAAAVYGSMRLRISQNIMRRIMVEEGEKATTLQLFDEMMGHIGHINTLRDKLAHQSLRRASSLKPGHWVVSDLLVTRGMSNLLEYEFTTADVAMATADLEAAFSRIKHFLRHDGSKLRAPRKLPAWQYRPTSLKLVRQRSERSAPKRKHPPRSSRASR